jgi:hypothetical protein
VKRMGLVWAMVLVGGLTSADRARAGRDEATATGDQTARIEALEETVTALLRQVDELRSSQPPEVSQTTVSEMVRAELSKGPGETLAKVAGWLEGLRLYGDMRVRYELISDRLNNIPDRQRARIRLRFGMDKALGKDWEMGFRLASGSSGDPTSTNQTLTDDFSKKPVWLDLAYVKYHPDCIPGLTIGAGKVANPFLTTDMLWDPDVNPEGLYETYRLKLADLPVEPFVTLGQFFLVDRGMGPDAGLVAYQGGVVWQVCPSVKWTTAVAMYDFVQYDEPGNAMVANGNTTRKLTSGPHKGKTILTAGDFNLLDVISQVEFAVPVKADYAVPVAVYADYVINTGDIFDDQKQGIAGGLRLGKLAKAGDWSVEYKYAYIEANAVAGAFSDSDFGFADRKGHKVGVGYLVHKSVALGLAGYFTGPVDAAGSPPSTTIQADVVLKF